MIYENLTCTSCGAVLECFDKQLNCISCFNHYPLLDGIPLFGEQDEIDQWTQYHTDPENSRLIASGGYLSEKPSPDNSYYSCFIPDESARVLDVGGGDGNTTSYWAKRHPESSVHLMDLSLHGLHKALRRNLPNMIPVCAPADRRFPFPDAHFDVVTTVFMIEHLRPDALTRFYREANRVLKPGGRLVVASDTRFYDSIIHPLERLVRNGQYVKNDPTHINLMTPRECEAWIAAEGFQLAERKIHFVAGRYGIARALYRLLPAGFAESIFSTMFVLTAKKGNL